MKFSEARYFSPHLDNPMFPGYIYLAGSIGIDPGLLKRLQIRDQNTSQYGMFELSTSRKRPVDDTVNKTG
jgi:hypothetical protein